MDFEKIKEVIADTVSVEEERITPEATLKEDLSIDSLDAVEIGIALEEAFGLSIPDEDLSAFVKVQDVLDYIQAHKA